MKLQIGYKVIRVSPDNRLYSMVICDKRFKLEYKVGELIKPRAVGTKIMAFSSLAYATAFYEVEKNLNHSEGIARIYRAILVNPQVLRRVFQVIQKPDGVKSGLYTCNMISSLPDYNIVTRNWKKLLDGDEEIRYIQKHTITSAPAGSLACSQIQLIGEITPSKL